MSSYFHTNGNEPKRNGENRLQPEQVLNQPNGLLAEASLGDILRIFFRHRRIVLSFFALVMIATGLYVLFVPRQYKSEAKLFVRLGRENVGLDATTTLGQAPPMTSVPASREEEINTVVLILESRGLLERVVDTIGAETILDPISHPLHKSTGSTEKAEANAKAAAAVAEPDQDSSGIMATVASGLEHLGLKSPLSLRERAVVQLRKHLTVEAAKKSNVILLAHEGPSPKVSQEIMAKLIDFYLDEHVRMNRTPHAHDFLKEQASALKMKLAGQEDRLRLLKNSTGLASPPEQRQNLVFRLAGSTMS